jgi:arylsulfatase A-like enzyme
MAAIAFFLPLPALADDPCEQITTACLQAGFTRGGAGEGKGLQLDCVRPIVQGKTSGRGSKPLPQVDPEVVAACNQAQPAFGRRAPPLRATEQPLSPTVPPVVPVESEPAQPVSTTVGGPPNIVFILTDDLSWNLVQYMPHVLAMQKKGASFTHYFVTDSLCCPSRASIFSGSYPHNTGIFRNVGKDGGYLAFRDRGHEHATFATAMSAVGYRTAMVGKYLNGYEPARDPVAPGWGFWAVSGYAYLSFDYDINQNGKVVHYGHQPADYLTDVLSTLSVRFIKESVGKPFMLEVATFAPHSPYTPAPRDANALPGLRAPRTLAFNSAPDANAPQWLKQHRPLSDANMIAIDRDFRKRAQSVLAVDAMIGELEAAVAAIGATANTYFVFSSDNGYHMGEHRLMPGKMTAFDIDIRVPLIVTGPGVPAGLTVEEITENVDLCPTFTELGGATSPPSIDGRSLVPLLRGQKASDWRSLALVEHHGPVKDLLDPDLPPSDRSGNPTTYEAIRGRSLLYVEYADGEREYHDLTVDQDELRNSFSSLSSEARAALHATLDALQRCRGATECAVAARGDAKLSKR